MFNPSYDTAEQLMHAIQRDGWDKSSFEDALKKAGTGKAPALVSLANSEVLREVAKTHFGISDQKFDKLYNP